MVCIKEDCCQQVVEEYAGRQNFDADGAAGSTTAKYSATHVQHARELLGIESEVQGLAPLEKNKRRYRVSSFQVLKAFHNMRMATVGAGLEAVQITQRQYELLEDPWDWTCDHLCSDQGPDMKCAKVVPPDLELLLQRR